MRSEVDHIFHIAVVRDWNAAKLMGEYRVSTLGRTLEEVGFIHASFRDQVARTGSYIYASVREPLTVLQIDPLRLAVPVRVENLDGGPELFPHIYGPLAIHAVLATIPAWADGQRFVVDWP